MVSRVFSAGLSGIDGYIVTAECFLSGGLPRLDVVGLPTGAVSEAGERVRAAAKACAFDWPVSRVTVNLAPADTKKAGTAYDLPILLAILAAAGEIDAPPQDAIFFGELSLTGRAAPGMRRAFNGACRARRGLPHGFRPGAERSRGVLCRRRHDRAGLRPERPARPSERPRAAAALSPAACAGRAQQCAGFLSCHGTARGQARARDRRRGRAQHPALRAARLGQEHDGQAFPHHPAAAVGQRTARGHPRLVGGRPRAGGGHAGGAPVPCAAPQFVRQRHWQAVRALPDGCPAGRRSRSRTAACCFWTSCPSSTATCSKPCASRSRTAGSRSRAWRDRSPTLHASS